MRNIGIELKWAIVFSLVGLLWMLGEKMINGKAALVETKVGKGQIVMFAFRPQHRGQTYATFPLIFNTLEK